MERQPNSNATWILEINFQFYWSTAGPSQLAEDAENPIFRYDGGMGDPVLKNGVAMEVSRPAAL